MPQSSRLPTPVDRTVLAIDLAVVAAMALLHWLDYGIRITFFAAASVALSIIPLVPSACRRRNCAHPLWGSGWFCGIGSLLWI